MLAFNQESFPALPLNSLFQSPRHIPSKYLYNANGSKLFEKICALPEYYLTRIELALLKENIKDICATLSECTRLVELGCGYGKKTQLIIDQISTLRTYIPVDICANALHDCVAQCYRDFPEMNIAPICGDYTKLPILYDDDTPERGTTVIYFPGSTIGNFHPVDAIHFLRYCRTIAGPKCAMLIGVDLQKDASIIEAAYNDAQGITAEFNRNILDHLNDYYGTDFNIENFSHQAPYNQTNNRIEMQLISTLPQRISFAEKTLLLRSNEAIITEYSYKYTPREFESLAIRAGFQPRRFWTDAKQWFGLWYLT